GDGGGSDRETRPIQMMAVGIVWSRTAASGVVVRPIRRRKLPQPIRNCFALVVRSDAAAADFEKSHSPSSKILSLCVDGLMAFHSPGEGVLSRRAFQQRDDTLSGRPTAFGLERICRFDDGP